MKPTFLIFTFLFSLNLFAAKIDIAYLCALGSYPDELDVIAITVSDDGEIKMSIKRDVIDPGTPEDCNKLATLLNSK